LFILLSLFVSLTIISPKPSFSQKLYNTLFSLSVLAFPAYFFHFSRYTSEIHPFYKTVKHKFH
jgi:hypothetical protein